MTLPSIVLIHSSSRQTGQTVLAFLEQLYTVVAVEFNSPPVPVVSDQQGAELQAALTVRFGGHTQLHNVLHQVGLNSCPLCFRPRPL